MRLSPDDGKFSRARASVDHLHVIKLGAKFQVECRISI